jgi:hypothetical protein
MALRKGRKEPVSSGEKCKRSYEDVFLWRKLKLERNFLNEKWFCEIIITSCPKVKSPKE